MCNPKTQLFMKTILSDLIKDIQDVHSTDHGNYYFFENYVISEINQGVTYNLETAQELIQLIIGHYGREASINLISNRVNNYSIVPTDWIKFQKSEYGTMLNSYSIVTYNDSSELNIMIEKLFLNIKVNHFNDVHHALNWINFEDLLESA